MSDGALHRPTWRRSQGRRPRGETSRSFLSEAGAVRVATGVALLVVVSYAVARLAEPAAGLAVGLGILGLALVAVSIAWWRRESRIVGRRSAWTASLAVAVILLEVGAIVAITVVFDRSLPGIAWAGFAVVALVAAALAAGILTAVVGDVDLRHEDAFRERAVSGDRRRRIVLVADAVPDPEAVRSLGDAVRGDRAELLVVVPALNSPVRHWTSDEDRARARAGRVLGEVLGELRAAGVDAHGLVGSDDPLQAIDDVLRIFPADEIVLAASSSGRLNWREQRLVERARAAYPLPITQLPTT